MGAEVLPAPVLAPCVPAKRSFDESEIQSTSTVNIGSSLGTPKVIHNRNVPELPRLQPLGELDANLYSFGGPVHAFLNSSELSPIQEEKEERTEEGQHIARTQPTTGEPQSQDMEPIDLSIFLVNDSYPPLPDPPGAISSVSSTTLSANDINTRAPLSVGFQLEANPPQVAQARPSQPTAPAHDDSPEEETSDVVSWTESPHSVFEDLGDTTSSYTASLLSDVKNFTYENGRRYHSYREGMYLLPNDEPEQDRQDLLHHVRNLVLHGRLFRAPLSDNIQRILDIGTGTGIWAIDAADAFPSAEVIGTDLSPIQPSWVPPNCRFIVDDAEADWLYSRSQPFDYIHARDMGGAIADWSRLLAQSFQHLRPGGWIELCEFEVMLRSDDDSIAIAPTLCEFLGHLVLASMQFKRPMNIAEHHRRHLIEAGFEDVRDEVYKVRPLPRLYLYWLFLWGYAVFGYFLVADFIIIQVPSNTWPDNSLQKEIGKYNLCSLLLAVESYSLALFTRVMGWSNEATQVFLAGVRADLKNPNVRTYCNLHVVYGRKPSHQ
ncbi:uncharacterized protein N7529_006164 [Penicillium soppii]|uniref:uncharacterized protein n=1 Tax=Penicillium soppii TaxID=69789 RepID=UPI0025483DF7|nr:uncharacterized protein N7529_006164 [Penicillium soppii]KAJ5864248.1 hypothetical protein N7529_006164 [Penicillium soppii]